jgi:hypothetical protein
MLDIRYLAIVGEEVIRSEDKDDYPSALAAGYSAYRGRITIEARRPALRVELRPGDPLR